MSLSSRGESLLARRPFGSLVVALLCAACGGAQPPAALELAPTRAASSAGAEPSSMSSFYSEPAAEPAAAQQASCRKMDFLFVIDNSLSMEREQANLARSFPGFLSVIARELRAFDYHIMVVDTDAMTPGEVVAAERHKPTTPEEVCDGTLGAGRRAQHGGDDCALSGGERFMGADQPELDATFECMARVGTAGSSYEQPVGALLGATSAALQAPGSCNDSFLRDDAVLVATIVTDEDDTASNGKPEDWRQSLLEVKHGDESALVLLGLVADDNRPQGLPGGPCTELGPGGAPRLQAFVESFSFGSLGAICADDYAPFFEQAVGVIGDACRQFVPPAIR
jgi:hypothetical protein